MIALPARNSLREWFTRPCGGREILRLALPIVVSSGTIALMNTADRIYLSWFDPVSMNAAFQSGNLIWALITFPTELAAFANAFVAQYHGAEQKERIGALVWQGVFLGLLFGLLFLAATPLVGPFFRALGTPRDVALLEQSYWFYFCVGAAAAIGHEPLASFYSGQREMKVVMKLGIATVALNMILDPLLIFGVGGYCRLGLNGAALASALSLWFKFFVYLALVYRRDKSGVYGFRKRCRLDWPEMKRLLRFGSMSGYQGTIENAFFSFFVLLMGWFGETASEATAICFNLNFLMLVPIFGMGVATTTAVGNQVGAGRVDLASRAAYTSATLACAFAAVFVIAFLVAPNLFLDMYMSGTPEKYAEVRPLAVNLLRIVAIYLFADTLNAIFTSALRGAGDTRFIMWATTLVVIPILAAIFGGVFLFGRGVYWCWILQTSYLFVNGAIFITRFVMGCWKDKSLVRPKNDIETSIAAN